MRLKSSMLNRNLYFLFSLFWLHGCGLFTFSGVSLPGDIQTFSIQEFYTETSDGPTDLPKKLTEALESKILRLTSLTKQDKDGDIQYEGVIKSFSYRTTFSTKSEDKDNPKEIQRLTITVEVSFINPSDETSSFNKKSFSASADMLYTENQNEKEKQLIKEIFGQLVDDICNKSIDNW